MIKKASFSITPGQRPPRRGRHCVGRRCDNSWLRPDKLLRAAVSVLLCRSGSGATKASATLEMVLMAAAAAGSMFSLARVTFTHRRLLIRTEANEGECGMEKKTNTTKPPFPHCALFCAHSLCFLLLLLLLLLLLFETRSPLTLWTKCQ